MLECSDEREPDRLAGDRDVRGVRVRGDDAVVRDRLDPRRLDERRTERCIGAGRRPEVDGADATLARVRELGGSVIHPGDRWAVCRDSEGSPFALAAPTSAE